MITFPADLTVLTPRATLRGDDGLENLITSKLANGCLCLVRGVGLYEFQRSSTVADPGGDSSPVVAPIAGPGRWVQVGTLLADGQVPMSWWVGDGIFFDEQTPLPGTWNYLNDTNLWVQQSATAPTDDGLVQVSIPYYPGRTLNSARVIVSGNGLHVALPAGLPLLTIIGRDIDSETADVVLGVNDPSADVAAYDSAHEIVLDATTVPGFPLDMAPNRVFGLSLRGERSTNAVDGALRLLGCQIDIT